MQGASGSSPTTAGLLAPDGRVVRTRARLEQRYFTRYEFERALRLAGFGNVRVFGNFERGPVTAGAHHWVLCATR